MPYRGPRHADAGRPKCIESSRFEAERAPFEGFGPGRTYDPTAWSALRERPVPDARRLRTEVPQGRGSAVLFATHPRPAYHAVVAPADREAQLYEYCAVRRE